MSLPPFFDRSMTKRSQRELAAVLEAYDFSTLGTIVDVGGGEGTLLISILKKHPQTQGIVFDQPVTIQRARSAINQAALADRCQAVGGDFFKAVPGGGDAYVLQTILHDWDDERAVTILKTCRRAMRNDAKLLVIDLVIPDAGDASREKFEDIVMMVMFDGMERTVEEFSALFQASGFALTNVIRTPIRCIVEGRPV
jgi:cyclopropane fatty-acyl-phospholipid synthase-like methyltransferase